MALWRCALLSILILVSAGCARVVPKVSHPHLIVDKDGLPLRVSEVREGELEQVPRDTYATSVVPDVLAAMEKYVMSQRAAGKRPRLLLYIHGGLVEYDEALANINTLVKVEDAGAPQRNRLRDTDFYPVFIVWNSSGPSSIDDDLFRVRQGEGNRVLAIPTSPAVILLRLGTSVLKAPIILPSYIDKGIHATKARRDEPVSPQERVSYWATSVLTAPTVAITYPLIAGFGAGAWEMMKRRIDEMLAIETERRRHHPGALRVFLKQFERRLEAWGKPIEVTLVGHSMGTMVINRALREFPRIRFDRIVYMGAAASVGEFRDTMVPYLQAHKGSRFYSFSLAIKRDAGERNALGLVPSGSLLTWIELFYEPGLSPRDKRVGLFKNQGILKVEDESCRRMTFVKLPDNEKYPVEHGQFNDHPKFQRVLEIVDMPDDDRRHWFKHLDPCTGAP